MEWIGLILQIILLGAFLFWEGYNKKKGENLAMKEDSRDINYEVEKGKNLATKEDIAQITQQIESIKDSYNKSLESHKIDLQKEFESHKYIMGLCQSLDRMLLHNIASCLSAEAGNCIDYPINDDSLLTENYKLSKFLSTYKERYDSIPIIHELIEISNDIRVESELSSFIMEVKSDYYCNVIPHDKKVQLITSLNKVLMYFIPALAPERIK